MIFEDRYHLHIFDNEYYYEMVLKIKIYLL